MPAILILIYLFLEVMATSSFSSSFGGGMLFLEIMTSGIVGIVLITSTGSHMNESLMSLRRGEINPRDLMSSTISRIVGGVLLFLPGILTDIIGLILQLNQVKTRRKERENLDPFKEDYRENNSNDDIVDVEVVDREVK